MKTYKIIRYFHPDENKRNEIIKTGLSLEEAQLHCRSKDTQKEGVFFDGYSSENREDEDES